MKTSTIIISQYLAALEMLKQTIEQCPDALWNAPQDPIKVWQIAYHVLFYTHLYLQTTAERFIPWAQHREDAPLMKPGQEDEPYDQQGLLEYLAICQQQVRECVPQQNLEGESGFHWLPFSKLELQFYNIRHLQQHTGELMERIGGRADLEFHWVAMVP